MTADDLFQILKQYYKIHLQFPTVQEFATYAELPVDVVAKVYKRWLNQGKLVKKGNTFDFYKEDPNKLFVEEKKQEKDNLEIVEVIQNKPEKKVKDWLFISIRILVGFIGVLLVLNSIHFTFNFNGMSMKLFWGFTLSVSIVSFMAIAFTLMKYIDGKFMKTFVFILWILGFVYSVFTAVSGQYNDFRKYLSNDKSQVINSQKEMLKEQLEIQTKKQTELLHWREQETEYSLNPDLKTENPGTWKTIQNGIEKLQECEDKIEELQNKLMNIVEVDTVSEETVYSWLCRTLKVSSDRLHLLIILFPSVFIDLCSGLCLMFALSKRKDP